MHKKLLFVIVALSLLLTACTDSDVSTVKTGTMPSYKTTSVGNAFDASFDSPKWTAFKGEKGERVVEFNGLISQGTHDNMVKSMMSEVADIKARPGGRGDVQAVCTNLAKNLMGEAEFQVMYETFSVDGVVQDDAWEAMCMEALNQKSWLVGTPVTVQWIVAPDGKEFKLTHMSSNAWANMKYASILDIVYN